MIHRQNVHKPVVLSASSNNELTKENIRTIVHESAILSLFFFVVEPAEIEAVCPHHHQYFWIFSLHVSIVEAFVNELYLPHKLTIHRPRSLVGNSGKL